MKAASAGMASAARVTVWLLQRILQMRLECKRLSYSMLPCSLYCDRQPVACTQLQ
jgi:hypothetical protein